MLKVTNGINHTYKYRRKLSSFGLVYTGESWETNNHSVEKRLRKYCKRKGLTLKKVVPEYSRSTSYRYKFLKENLGDKGDGSRYHCAYCGRRLTKDNLQVDHIISIASVQKTQKARRLLKKYRLKDVNDIGNLTASCGRCNERKGENGGLWILRGRLGRSKYYWAIVKVLIITASIAFVYTGIETGGLELLWSTVSSFVNLFAKNLSFKEILG